MFRDGVVSPLVEARVTTRYDDAFRQTDADIDVIDESGRTTRLTVKRFAIFGFEAGGRALLNEAGCTATIDGVEAVAHFECGWDREYAATQADRPRA